MFLISLQNKDQASEFAEVFRTCQEELSTGVSSTEGDAVHPVPQASQEEVVTSSAKVDLNVVEEVVVASSAWTTGDQGNVHYAQELGAAEVVEEPVTVASAGRTGGDIGNPHYRQELGNAQSTCHFSTS